METIIRRIRDLPQSDRSALEQVVGHALDETQQIILSVVSLESAAQPQSEFEATDVPNWWNINEGLSDEEMDRLDQAIRQRANLTRAVEST